MKLTDIGAPVAEKDLQQLEAELGVILPADYQEFLLLNNGGMPEEDVEFEFIEIDSATGERYDQGSDIQYFYNIDELLEAYQNLTDEGLIEKDSVPIASDSFGNTILLCRDGVFFVNHEIEVADGETSPASFVASSFNEFINMLKPMEI